MARVSWPEDHPPRVEQFELRPWQPGESQESQLTGLRRDYALDQARCTSLLDGSEYSLLLTEAPEVPEEELRSAIRWRVKDLIDFPVESATVDVFSVPGDKQAGRSGSVYAVAAQRQLVQARVRLLQQAGINVAVVDIPEMAQRNLALLMPQEASGILFITFGTHDGLITLSKQGEIYLTRRVDTGLDLLTAEGDTTVYYDRVVLEIQRSLDYYDSYFRQPPISSVVLAPATSELQPLADYLRANLNSNVEIFDPSAWLDWPAPGDAPLSGDSLLVLGAALRREEGA